MGLFLAKPTASVPCGAPESSSGCESTDQLLPEPALPKTRPFSVQNWPLSAHLSAVLDGIKMRRQALFWQLASESGPGVPSTLLVSSPDARYAGMVCR